MKKEILIAIIGCLLMGPLCALGQSLSSDEIMDRLEARYNVQGIFVRFHQASTYKALDITYDDAVSARGRIYIKRPGRMRWEYETPDKEFWITDGTSLWVYSPDDNQVMIGAADTFFGEGKGADFLADMTLIRKYFSVELASDDPVGHYVLKLSPNEPSGETQLITLAVSKENFNILQVVTENGYGDETRFSFETPDFGRELDDALFTFTPPEGAEIIALEE